MAGTSSLFISMLLCLACIQSKWFAYAGELDPKNVGFNTLNMNFSIHWSPPGETWENEIIYYSVVRDPAERPFYVDGCINITKTFCSLIDVYPKGDGFYPSEFYYIESRSDSRDNSGKTWSRFTRHHIRVSAPIVYNHTTKSRWIKVSIRGPETPFRRNGKPMYMGDKKLGVGLPMGLVKFNATLYNKDVTESMRRPIPLYTLVDGFGEIIYDELQPYTRYVIEIQGKLNELSDDVTRFEFYTDPEAPDVGPIITDTDITKRYCDYRDVTITWKNSDDYESNGPLTNYFVQFKREDKNESNYIDVSMAAKSVVLFKLYRWKKYKVIVSAANKQGRCDGTTSYIEADTPNTETYKPIIEGVTKISNGEWSLSWTPPGHHHQCIVGYRIMTYVNSDNEESIIVDGFNTSTATLNFKQTGRYHIDLRAIVNDSVNTIAFTTTVYSAKVTERKLREWTIFTGVAFVMVIVVTAVAAMTKKVFCDYSNLPDISTSRSMKIARSIRPDDTSLKAPPTREHFDSTRLDTNILHYYTTDGGDFSLEDDVFQPKSTSTSLLLSSSSSSANDACKLHTLRSEKRSSAKNEYDKEEFSMNPSMVKPEEISRRSGSPIKRRPMRAGNVVPDASEGYVPHGFTKEEPLTVAIPVIKSATSISSPSSSSDSGIAGSVSDYAPSSPLSGVDENIESWGDSGSSSCADFKSESPYVTTALATPFGRINSTSLSSETDVVLPFYKRLDSRGSSQGYLPMNPVTPLPIEPRDRTDKTQSRRSGENLYTSSAISSPYSKISSQEINSTKFV